MTISPRFRPLVIIAIFTLGVIGATLLDPVAPDVAPWVSTGVGGLVAVVVLNWKRIDDQRYAETLKGMNEKLIDVLMKNTETTARLVTIVDSQQSRQRRSDQAFGSTEG